MYLKSTNQPKCTCMCNPIYRSLIYIWKKNMHCSKGCTSNTKNWPNRSESTCCGPIKLSWKLTTDSSKSSGGFTFLKPKPPHLIKKPFQLRLNLHRSSEDHASYAQIRLHLALFRSDLTSFGTNLTMLCSPPLSSDNILLYYAQIQRHLAFPLLRFSRVNSTMLCSPPLSFGNILLCFTQIWRRSIDRCPPPLLNWLSPNWSISCPSPIQLAM